MAAMQTRILSILAAGLLVLSAVFIGAGAQEIPSQREIIDASLSGPVFLNAYWTDRSANSTSTDDATTPVRREVGPGEGAATLAVVLVNRGLSDITAIAGQLSLPQGFSANGRAMSDSTAVATFDDIVKASDTFTLYFDVNVSDKTHVGTYNAYLDVEFSKIIETGTLRHSNLVVPFQLTGKVILDPVAITHNLVPGVANTVDFEIRNSGTAAATGVTVTITGITVSGGSVSDSGNTSTQGQVTNFGNRTFNVGTIPPDSSVRLTSSIFPNISAGGATSAIQLEIKYNDAYGNVRTMSPTLGLVVLPGAPSLVSVKAASSNENDNWIIAGKVDDFVLEIANTGAKPITNVVVSMQPKSDSVNILGDSKWEIETIDAKSKVQLPTQVFASTSLIGNPASFDVTVDYLLNGESNTERMVLGTYVDGEISIRAYDLMINYIGDRPNLVGNLLNEGNTAALFTAVEIVQSPRDGANQQLAPSTPQYLGDLSANSPLPFSIPLNLPRNAEPGSYAFTLKVTYKDNLRNAHEFVTSGNVVLEPQQPANLQARNQSPMAGLLLPLIIGGAATAAAIVFVVRRRRRSKRLMAQNNGPEKGENIKDVLRNPSAGKEKDHPA